MCLTLVDPSSDFVGTHPLGEVDVLALAVTPRFQLGGSPKFALAPSFAIFFPKFGEPGGTANFARNLGGRQRNLGWE